METKLTSVIIPTYKRDKRLSIAINSLLNQTYKNIEIIVVDDNDPNTKYRKSTEKVMQQYEDNPKVIYIQHEMNRNGAAARNTGIKRSKGDYICFLDDDDIYLPKKIEMQVDFLAAHKEHNGVYCGRIEKGKKITGSLSGDLSKEILSLSFTPTTPALMFRSNIIKGMEGFNENFKRHQDFELLLRYFKNNSLGAISEPLVEIGQNEGENELHGELLETTKEAFLDIFKSEIDRIDGMVKGFKRSVYIAHYVPVFWDHISQFEIIRGYKIYLKGIKISFINFNIGLAKYLLKYLRFLMGKQKEKYEIEKTSL